MRTYNRQFLNKDMKSVAAQSIELQNGIIWSIDTTEHSCGVKLLGSNEIINVDFPPSWMVVPNWIQLGSPVQMSHRYGFKNALEIIGPGHIIPAQTGDNTPYLNPSTLTNRIMSGCIVHEVYISPAMTVNIDSGSVRIGGDTVTVNAVSSATVTPAPSSVNNIRYDMFVVGTDAVIDLITGTTFRSSATAATIPDVPEAHIELSRILVHYGQTAIDDNDIDRAWSVAAPQVIALSANDTDLSSAVATAAITAEVQDQYQNALPPANTTDGWAMELEISPGAGIISSTVDTSTSVVSAQTGSSAGVIFQFAKAGGASVDDIAIFTARLTTISMENSLGIIVRGS